MADPGVVPGIIGAVIAELLHAAIVEAKKVIFFRKHCRDLVETLQKLEPTVKEISERGTVSTATNLWLKRAQVCFEEANAIISECAIQSFNPIQSFNLIFRRDISSRILKLMHKIKDTLPEAIVVNVDLITLLEQKIESLHGDLKYLELAARTSSCTQSESYSKERATFIISTEATRHSDNSFLLESNNDTNAVTELQPIPKLVFGIEDMASELEQLLQDEEVPYVGVWGKGGAGKTLLTQTANNSRQLQAHFSGGIFWLTVGRNPDIGRLQNELCRHISRAGVNVGSSSIKTKLYNLLRNKRILLILDDVWSPPVLDEFDVVDEESGGKILVTTRNRPVLEKLPFKVLEVKMLSPEDSWKLLCSYAFPGEQLEHLNDNLPPGLAELVNEVVLECKGLPLALKVIGSTMAGQIQVEQWKSALTKLKRSQVLEEDYEIQVYKRLRLSYDELLTVDRKRGATLQECFLYFAAFKEDATVQVESLVKYWVGEDLIKYKEGEDYDEDPEVEAYYILGQLIGRSLIDLETTWSDSHNTKLLACKIHDVLQDLAIYILEHTHEIHDMTCLFRAGNGLHQLPREWAQKRNLKAQKLSLMSNSLKEIPNLQAPDLRVLLLNENSELTIRGRFLKSFKNLTVLDLSRTGIEELPKGIRRLENLAVLDLSYCSRLKLIPESIGTLKKLEHFTMQNCGSITEFPSKQMSKLVTLRYLNTRGCGDIWLQEKQLFCSRTTVSPGLEHLSGLTGLRRLWIGSPTIEYLPNTMSRLNKLRQLSVYFQELKELPDELQSLSALEILDFNTSRSLVKLPDWLLASYASLITLDLRGCGSLLKLPPGLEKLQLLTKLDLSACTSLRTLPHEYGGAQAFASLQELWLMGCYQIELFPELHDRALKRLTLLNLVDCKMVKQLPSRFEVLYNIVNLNLNMSGLKELPGDEVIKSLKRLEVLSLNGTQITNLPASIGTLPCLKRLFLRDCNCLQSLPEDTGAEKYFDSLEEIDLSQSGIRQLSMKLAAAPQLRKVILTSCNQSVYDQQELLSCLQKKRVQVIGWLLP